MPTVNDSAALNQGVDTDDGLHVGGLLNNVAGAFAWLPKAAANDGNKGKVVTATTTEAPASALSSNPTLAEALTLANAKGAVANDKFTLSTADGATIEYGVYGDGAGGIVLERESDLRLRYPAGVSIGDLDPADFADINATVGDATTANVRISLIDGLTGKRTGYHIDPAEVAPRTWTSQGENYGDSSGSTAPGTAQNLQSVTDEGNTTGNDLEVTQTARGVVLLSPNSTRFRTTVDDTGQLITSPI